MIVYKILSTVLVMSSSLDAQHFVIHSCDKFVERFKHVDDCYSTCYNRGVKTL